ncbi:MAG: bifunctional diaminohydroxyphosphoribosylaminopyrimidine deaminase/5-amino-6-(5-phosphoribosylamino)uracil reductase RibD, partial [Rhizobiaceae bacterium]|nr:bifunctional diaminohydroxyphosphoribosylaminopyrimidine deaminase/5-amino-6-(5-phosphoribosylamino)uracil reductase RibD [Rhizobiaceae bacterium]
EPCAHHGRTPPCAEALVAAGIARVVSAAADPDARVNGRGHAILQAGGLSVTPSVLSEAAAQPLSGYLARVMKKRPEVTLKMALSKDGKIGRAGGGQVFISGPVSNAQTHLVRARHDAILVGVGTLIEDDPSLTCRAPGLTDRSPLRIVLDARLETPLDATLVRTARDVPTALAIVAGIGSDDLAPFRAAGCDFIACEAEPGTERIALEEMLEDLAARGISSILVEGGAKTGAAFLAQGLVDRIILVEGEIVVGEDGVSAPLGCSVTPQGFRKTRELRLGGDVWREYEKG